jgi:hypothetical protein
LSTTLIKPFGADWTVGRHLARFGGDFLGNPFQALVDLIPHDSFQQYVIQTKAFKAVAARIEAEANVAKLSAKVEGLSSEVGKP